MIEGAPGHGKATFRDAAEYHRGARGEEVMEREHLTGTLKLWPGIAEELLGTKAYYGAGLFKDVDIRVVCARGR